MSEVLQVDIVCCTFVRRRTGGYCVSVVVLCQTSYRWILCECCCTFVRRRTGGYCVSVVVLCQTSYRWILCECCCTMSDVVQVDTV